MSVAVRFVHPCVRHGNVRAEVGRDDHVQRDRRGLRRHEIVVVIPDQDLDPFAVYGREGVYVRLPADAVRQELVERNGAAAPDRETLPTHAAEELERV
jgi:hypothetical protein